MGYSQDAGGPASEFYMPCGDQPFSIVGSMTRVRDRTIGEGREVTPHRANAIHDDEDADQSIVRLETDRIAGRRAFERQSWGTDQAAYSDLMRQILR